MNSNQALEYASKETFDRWRNDPNQSLNAERNVAYAIEKALNDQQYNFFTSRNNARSYIASLGADEISYALIYNMIQLSEYRRSRNHESLGNVDSDIMVAVESCKNNEAQMVVEQLQKGARMVMDEREMLSRYPNLSTEEVGEQKRRLADARYRNSPSDQRAYEFASSAIDSYVEYNVHYKLVSSNNPIQSQYEQVALNGLNNYFVNKSMGNNQK